MTVVDVHQCPRCELRFASRPELADHVRTDHLPTPGDDIPAPVPAGSGTLLVAQDPTADPTRVVPFAATLARQVGMRLEIAAVPPIGLGGPVDLRGAAEAARRAGGPEVRARVLTSASRVGRAILDRAALPDVALLCIATHGGGPRAALAGSVGALVIRSSPVPVVVLGPQHARTAIDAVHRVVACVDGSDRAALAVPVAAALAQRLGARTVILHVAPCGSSARGRGLGLDGLRRLADTLEGLATFDLLRDDDPAQAIVRYAGDGGDTLVALATHDRGGVLAAVLGSVTATVVDAARCPVLVVPRRATLR